MHALASPTGDRGSLRPDGRFGQRTREAVMDFQRRYQLTVDGVIGPRTWQALVTTAGARSAPGEAVLAVQLQLRALGYALTADGIYGPSTAGAVREFQSLHGLRADAVTGTDTWRALVARSPG